MTEKLMVVEADCSTGVITEREFTEQEYAAYDKMVQESAARKAQAEAEAQAKAFAKGALLNKLGITAEEAKLLLS